MKLLFVSFLASLGLWGCFSEAPLAQVSEPPEISPLWSLNLEAPPNLSPSISADSVVVASGTSLWAVELASGNPRWRFTPPEGLWERSYLVSEETVWIALQDHSLVALDLHDGTERWRVSLGLNAQVPPLLSGGILYAVTTRVGEPLNTLKDPTQVFAINAKNGEVVWSRKIPHYASQTPAWSNGKLYIGGSYYAPEIQIDEGGPMLVQALDAQTGELLWETRRLEGFVKALHATAERVAYIAYQDFLVGLDATTGQLLWKRDTGNWVPSLRGLGDVVFWGSANTRVFAYEMWDGTRLWEHDIPWGAFNYLMGAPTLGDGTLYGLSQRGHLFALDAKTGEPLWSASTGLTSRVGAAFAPGRAVIGDEKGWLFGFQISE